VRSICHLSWKNDLSEHISQIDLSVIDLRLIYGKPVIITIEVRKYICEWGAATGILF